MPSLINSVKYVFVILSWTVVLFLAMSHQSPLGIQGLIAQFLNGFYIPHHNFCPVGKIAGWNIMLCVYTLIFLSAATLVILKIPVYCRNKIISWKSRDDFQLAPTIKHLMSLFLVLVIAFQTMNQAIYFIALHQKYHGKTIEKKRQPLLKEISRCAQYYQEKLPGRHNAQFLSDLDISKDPGMFIHRALAYYLYPIDIRGIREGPKDSLIIFYKKEAGQHIPEGYKLIEQINEYNAVAIKSGDNP